MAEKRADLLQEKIDTLIAKRRTLIGVLASVTNRFINRGHDVRINDTIPQEVISDLDMAIRACEVLDIEIRTHRFDFNNPDISDKLSNGSDRSGYYDQLKATVVNTSTCDYNYYNEGGDAYNNNHNDDIATTTTTTTTTTNNNNSYIDKSNNTTSNDDDSSVNKTTNTTKNQDNRVQSDNDNRAENNNSNSNTKTNSTSTYGCDPDAYNNNYDVGITTTINNSNDNNNTNNHIDTNFSRMINDTTNTIVDTTKNVDNDKDDDKDDDNDDDNDDIYDTTDLLKNRESSERVYQTLLPGGNDLNKELEMCDEGSQTVVKQFFDPNVMINPTTDSTDDNTIYQQDETITETLLKAMPDYSEYSDESDIEIATPRLYSSEPEEHDETAPIRILESSTETIPKTPDSDVKAMDETSRKFLDKTVPKLSDVSSTNKKDETIPKEFDNNSQKQPRRSIQQQSNETISKQLDDETTIPKRSNDETIPKRLDDETSPKQFQQTSPKRLDKTTLKQLVDTTPGLRLKNPDSTGQNSTHETKLKKFDEKVPEQFYQTSQDSSENEDVRSRSESSGSLDGIYECIDDEGRALEGLPSINQTMKKEFDATIPSPFREAIPEIIGEEEVPRSQYETAQYEKAPRSEYETASCSQYETASPSEYETSSRSKYKTVSQAEYENAPQSKYEKESGTIHKPSPNKRDDRIETSEPQADGSRAIFIQGFVPSLSNYRSPPSSENEDDIYGTPPQYDVAVTFTAPTTYDNDSEVKNIPTAERKKGDISEPIYETIHVEKDKNTNILKPKDGHVSKPPTLNNEHVTTSNPKDEHLSRPNSKPNKDPIPGKTDHFHPDEKDKNKQMSKAKGQPAENKFYTRIENVEEYNKPATTSHHHRRTRPQLSRSEQNTIAQDVVDKHNSENMKIPQQANKTKKFENEHDDKTKTIEDNECENDHLNHLPTTVVTNNRNDLINKGNSKGEKNTHSENSASYENDEITTDQFDKPEKRSGDTNIKSKQKYKTQTKLQVEDSSHLDQKDKSESTPGTNQPKKNQNQRPSSGTKVDQPPNTPMQPAVTSTTNDESNSLSNNIIFPTGTTHQRRRDGTVVTKVDKATNTEPVVDVHLPGQITTTKETTTNRRDIRMMRPSDKRDENSYSTRKHQTNQDNSDDKSNPSQDLKARPKTRPAEIASSSKDGQGEISPNGDLGSRHEEKHENESSRKDKDPAGLNQEKNKRQKYRTSKEGEGNNNIKPHFGVGAYTSGSTSNIAQDNNENKTSPKYMRRRQNSETSSFTDGEEESCTQRDRVRPKTKISPNTIKDKDGNKNIQKQDMMGRENSNTSTSTEAGEDNHPKTQFGVGARPKAKPGSTQITTIKDNDGTMTPLGLKQDVRRRHNSNTSTSTETEDERSPQTPFGVGARPKTKPGCVSNTTGNSDITHPIHQQGPMNDANTTTKEKNEEKNEGKSSSKHPFIGVGTGLERRTDSPSSENYYDKISPASSEKNFRSNSSSYANTTSSNNNKPNNSNTTSHFDNNNQINAPNPPPYDPDETEVKQVDPLPQIPRRPPNVISVPLGVISAGYPASVIFHGYKRRTNISDKPRKIYFDQTYSRESRAYRKDHGCFVVPSMGHYNFHLSFKATYPRHLKTNMVSGSSCILGVTRDTQHEALFHCDVTHDNWPTEPAQPLKEFSARKEQRVYLRKGEIITVQGFSTDGTWCIVENSINLFILIS